MSENNNMQNTPVTFHVFRKDGSRLPDLKSSFIEKMKITAEDAISGCLILGDATKWSLILETAVQNALKDRKEVDCIVSFQVRVRGNYAVARIFDPNYKAKAKRR